MGEHESIIQGLIKDFNDRIKYRDDLESKILVIETKLVEVESDFENKSKKLSDLNSSLIKKQNQIDETIKLIKSKDELELIVEPLREELSSLRLNISDLQTKKDNLKTTIESQNKELESLTISCSTYMKNVALYTNDLNKKRKDLLEIEKKHKAFYQPQIEELAKERESIEIEKQKLATIKKETDARLAKLALNPRTLRCHKCRDII